MSEARFPPVTRATIQKTDATDLVLSAAQFECDSFDLWGDPRGAFNVIIPHDRGYTILNRTNYPATVKHAGEAGWVVKPGDARRVPDQTYFVLRATQRHGEGSDGG